MTKVQEDRTLYFHKETLIYSLEKRRIDLLTISSFDKIADEKEELIDGLFPEHKGDKTLRPYKFYNKKIIFLSCRVHPGETAASHVLNGILNLICE
jgi:hypothetical protein